MFCRNCGKEIADQAKFCPGCGAAVGQAAAPAAASVKKAAPSVVMPKAKKKNGKVLVAAVAVVLVALVIFGAVKLLGSLGGGKGSEGFVFVNEDGEWLLQKDMKEDTEELEVTDESLYEIMFSADGKYLYYIEADGETLYKISVSDVEKGERAEKIDKKVDGLLVLENGDVLYIKDDELCLYDGKDSYDLADDVYDIVGLDQAEKYFYYTEEEDDDMESLHRVALKKNAESEELIKEYSYLYTDVQEDYSTLVYSVKEEDSNEKTIYSVAPGKDPEELLDEEIHMICGMKANDSKVSFYYAVLEEKEVTLYDFFSDESGDDDDDIEYLRDSCKDADLTFELLTVYYYEGGKTTEVASNLWEEGTLQYHDVGDKGVLLYNRLTALDTPIADLADVDDLSEAWEIYGEKIDENYYTYYQYVDGKELPLELEEECELGAGYAFNDKEVALIASEYDGNDTYLLGYKLGGSGLELVGTIEEDDFSDVCVFDGELYYAMDSNGHEGDVYKYANGKSEEVVSECNALYKLEDGSVYVVTDYDFGIYTLNEMGKKGKLEEVAEDIATVWFLGDGKVAYVDDTDLMLWDGKDEICLAEDVEGVIFAHEAEIVDLILLY